MKRFVAVFDASPLESAPWMEAAAKAMGLKVVSLVDVSQRLSADPKARELLLKSATPNRDAALNPHYLAAFEAVAGKAPRVAVQSVTWVSRGLVPDAVLLSFDQMEAERAKAKTLGFSDRDFDARVSEAKATVKSFLKGVPAAHVLEVRGDDAAKVQAATEFLRARTAP